MLWLVFWTAVAAACVGGYTWLAILDRRRQRDTAMLLRSAGARGRDAAGTGRRTDQG